MNKIIEAFKTGIYYDGERILTQREAVDPCHDEKGLEIIELALSVRPRVVVLRQNDELDVTIPSSVEELQIDELNPRMKFEDPLTLKRFILSRTGDDVNELIEFLKPFENLQMIYFEDSDDISDEQMDILMEFLNQRKIVLKKFSLSEHFNFYPCMLTPF